MTVRSPRRAAECQINCLPGCLLISGVGAVNRKERFLIFFYSISLCSWALRAKLIVTFWLTDGIVAAALAYIETGFDTMLVKLLLGERSGLASCLDHTIVSRKVSIHTSCTKAHHRILKILWSESDYIPLFLNNLSVLRFYSAFRAEKYIGAKWDFKAPGLWFCITELPVKMSFLSESIEIILLLRKLGQTRVLH